MYIFFSIIRCYIFTRPVLEVYKFIDNEIKWEMDSRKFINVDKLYILPIFYLQNYCHKLVLPLLTWDLLHMKSQFHMYDNLQTHLRSTIYIYIYIYIKDSKNAFASTNSRYETHQNKEEIFCEILESDCDFGSFFIFCGTGHKMRGTDQSRGRGKRKWEASYG